MCIVFRRIQNAMMWFTVKWKLATGRKVGLFWSVELIIIQKVKTWTLSLNFAISYLPSETAEKSHSLMSKITATDSYVELGYVTEFI